MQLLEKRHPKVEHRRVPLTEQRWELQKQRGLYTVERGEPLAIPVDRLDDPTVFDGRVLWERSDEYGIYRPGTKFRPPYSQWQRKLLTWLRDNVDHRIPEFYYHMVLGHDLHVSTFANLYAQHWHRGWVNPFTKAYDEPLDHTFETAPWHPAHVEWRDDESMDHWRARGVTQNYGHYGGFVENLGWLSGAKVTDAFVSEEVDELVSATASEFADFDSHEVGTSSQAENNNDTALITTSGIARAAGSPVDEDPDYANDGTITADATETWEEHGIFNNTSGAAMMDRSLTGGQAVNSSDQVTYQYTLTLAPEA